MIRLKNKKAAEEKKAADDLAAASSAVPNLSSSDMEAESAGATAPNEGGDATESGEGSAVDNGLKLFGIGGKAARSADVGAKKSGKRKTPGELRIQKGTKSFDMKAKIKYAIFV